MIAKRSDYGVGKAWPESIRAVCEAFGSAAAAARHCGMCASTVSDLARGTRSVVSDKNREKFKQALGWTDAELPEERCAMHRCSDYDGSGQMTPEDRARYGLFLCVWSRHESRHPQKRFWDALVASATAEIKHPELLDQYIALRKKYSQKVQRCLDSKPEIAII